ncbi:MAG: hypothetical protein HOI47_23075 [Candidatus Scalindua sp.]|mgnify:FL=1|jgi:hypothetical protein|nr:hypothetical protein [Bacteroidota bacterium]MBT6229537.1 hypothetical protein [Candidatus Scalindua sp.]
MEKKDNGDVVIDKTTIDIAKELLVAAGLVFVLTRVVQGLFLIQINHKHE